MEGIVFLFVLIAVISSAMKKAGVTGSKKKSADGTGAADNTGGRPQAAKPGKPVYEQIPPSPIQQKGSYQAPTTPTIPQPIPAQTVTPVQMTLPFKPLEKPAISKEGFSKPLAPSPEGKTAHPAFDPAKAEQKSKPKAVPSAASLPTPVSYSAASMRSMIVMKEILDKPVALRGKRVR